MNAPQKQTRVEAQLGRAMVRIAELEEENARLKRLMQTARGTPPAWGLTKNEERLLLAMEASFPCLLTVEGALEIVWPDTHVQAKILSVMVHRIRKKIDRGGMIIETVRGRGYRLRRDIVDAIRDHDISVDMAG